MGRAAYTLLVLAGLSAWAGAQQPAAGLSAADRLRLFRANRVVLAELVGNGVELAGADDPLARAAAYGRSVRALGVAFRAAAEAGDADRAADLGDNLAATVRDGLVPVLDEAGRAIPPESPRFPELRAARAKAARDLDEFRGVGGDSPKVRGVRDRLDGLAEKLK